MVKSISTLRKERDKLLKGSAAGKLKSNRVNEALMERRKLEQEIRLLKNPRLASAGKKFGKFAKATGKFLKERANIVTANIEREMREERARKQGRPTSRPASRPTSRTKTKRPKSRPKRRR